MNKMSILEYLAFTNNVNPKLRATLKEIYFRVQNGKEATIELDKRGIKCVVDKMPKPEDFNEYSNGVYYEILEREVATFILSEDGEILEKTSKMVPVNKKENIRFL